jgi:hypothetical protein
VKLSAVKLPAVDSDGVEPDGAQVNGVGVADAELAANVIPPIKAASFARLLTFDFTLIGGTPN